MFRLAYTLKKTVTELLSLPRWEIEAWRALFDIVGPLDWKRTDLLFARVNQYQSAEAAPLKEFILFGDPTVKEDDEKSRREREKELLYKLGYREEKE